MPSAFRSHQPTQAKPASTTKHHATAEGRKAHLFRMRAGWRRFRRRYLRSHPLCMDCKIGHRFVPATEVHHIVKVTDDWHKRLDESNMMALCSSCHSKRTRKGE